MALCSARHTLCLYFVPRLLKLLLETTVVALPASKVDFYWMGSHFSPIGSFDSTVHRHPVLGAEKLIVTVHCAV